MKKTLFLLALVPLIWVAFADDSNSDKKAPLSPNYYLTAGSRAVEEAKATYDNQLYMVAKASAKLADKMLNKALDRTFYQPNIEKIKIKLDSLKSLSSQITSKIDRYDEVGKEMWIFPYSEVANEFIGCDFDTITDEDYDKMENDLKQLSIRKFSSESEERSFLNYFSSKGECLGAESLMRVWGDRYIQALESLKQWNLTGASESMNEVRYLFPKNYKLIYNLAYLNYKLGQYSSADSLLREIYDVANITQNYDQRISKLPEITPKADALLELMKKKQQSDVQKKVESEKKVQEESKPKEEKKMDAIENNSYISLWEKAKIIESLVPIIKARDEATQNRIKAILEGFMASSDEYTRNVGVYLSYLLK